MKQPWGYLLLSVALHASAGWLLHALQAEPEPLPMQAPMAIQLVSLAPAAQPLPVAPARQQPTPRPAQTTAPPPKVAMPIKPAPAVAKPAPVKPAPAITNAAPPPRSEARPHQTAVAADTARPSATPPTPARIASAPVAVAPPTTPVLSLRPSFVSPPPPPRYPSQARRRNQQGIVRVEVCLDERGRQLKLTLVRSSGVASLDQAALDAVTTWRFRPEIVDGRAVPSRVEIPIEFALTANR